MAVRKTKRLTLSEGKSKVGKAAREALRQLAALYDDSLLPEEVVAAAKPRTSPLHNYFDWNDTTAAARYRLVQARWLITHVFVVAENVTAREYTIITDDEGRRSYRHVSRVLEDEDWRQQMLQEAMKELEQFKRKYRRLKELASIFEAIDGL